MVIILTPIEVFRIINKLSLERLPFATYEPQATEDYVISKTKSLFSSLTDTLGLHYMLTFFPTGAACHQCKFYSESLPLTSEARTKRADLKGYSPKLHFSESTLWMWLKHCSTFISLGVSVRKFSLKGRKCPLHLS